MCSQCVRACLSWLVLCYQTITASIWPGRGLPVRFRQLMRWRTQVEWSGWRRGCQCVKGFWICSTHVGSGLCGCGGVWWNVIDVIVCLLMLTRLCCTSGVVCGLPVVSQKFLENGGPLSTGWCCCGCVLAP